MGCCEASIICKLVWANCLHSWGQVHGTHHACLFLLHVVESRGKAFPSEIHCAAKLRLQVVERLQQAVRVHLSLVRFLPAWLLRDVVALRSFHRGAEDDTQAFLPGGGEIREGLSGCRLHLAVPPPLFFLVDASSQFLHGVLNSSLNSCDLKTHQQHLPPQVLGFATFQILHKVFDFCVAIFVGQEPEHHLQVILVDVHRTQNGRQLPMLLVAFEDFFQSQLAAVVLIDFHHQTPQLIHSMFVALLLLLDPLLGILVLCLGSPFDDDSEHQVGKAQLNGDQRATEDEGCNEAFLNDRNRTGPPGVTGKNSLKEKQHALLHC
mmetsp:Transcript_74531/g.155378  ORF Transcript_74531/g.155378 Transcript_74531/m.155378 type:complete len:321 (-) Transcript_74531:841-1803(-)